MGRPLLSNLLAVNKRISDESGATIFSQIPCRFASFGLGLTPGRLRTGLRQWRFSQCSPAITINLTSLDLITLHGLANLAELFTTEHALGRVGRIRQQHTHLVNLGQEWRLEEPFDKVGIVPVIEEMGLSVTFTYNDNDVPQGCEAIMTQLPLLAKMMQDVGERMAINGQEGIRMVMKQVFKVIYAPFIPPAASLILRHVRDKWLEKCSDEVSYTRLVAAEEAVV